MIHGQPELGPTDVPAVHLGELVEPVSAQPVPAVIREWVMPPNVHRETGAVRVRHRRDKSGVGYALGSNLVAGDVLVPRRSIRPCVLVDDRFKGVAFSEGFTAIRSHSSLQPALLWAYLSSRSGLSVRKRLLTGGTMPYLSWRSLRDISIHVPSLERQMAVVRQLPRPQVSRDEYRRSAWLLSSALDGNWEHGLIRATLGFEPAHLLRDICEVMRGRVRKADRRDLPLPGLVPVCLPEMIRREDWHPIFWAAPIEPLTDGKSIALPAIRPFHAGVPPAGMAVGHGAFLLRQRQNADATVRAGLLCEWLNDDQGQEALKALSASHLIPGVSLSGLRELPMPVDWTAASPIYDRAPVHDAVALADELEGVCR
jgi:hypothetical protein